MIRDIASYSTQTVWDHMGPERQARISPVIEHMNTFLNQVSERVTESVHPRIQYLYARVAEVYHSVEAVAAPTLTRFLDNLNERYPSSRRLLGYSFTSQILSIAWLCFLVWKMVSVMFWPVRVVYRYLFIRKPFKRPFRSPWTGFERSHEKRDVVFPMLHESPTPPSSPSEVKEEKVPRTTKKKSKRT